MKNITSISVHVSTERDDNGMNDAHFITLTSKDAEGNVSLLLKAISALHSIVQQYETPEQKGL